MNNKQWTISLIVVSFSVLLSACSGGTSAPDDDLSTEDEIATTVAKELAVAATLTAAANQTVTANAEVAIAQATATPTQVVVAILPTDTATPTFTPIPPNTSTFTPIPLDRPTNTPIPVDTETPIPTNTPTQVVVAPPSPVAPSTTVPLPTETATQTPSPTPTQVVAVPAPIDGGADDLVFSTDPSNGGRNILLPGLLPNEITSPMVFRNRIGLALSIYSANASQPIPGVGVQEVTFEVTDLETGERVYEKVESASLYCLFGGNTLQECTAQSFAQLEYRWPSSGEPIYNGDYQVDMFIETETDSGNWNYTFSIEGALDRNDSTGATFSGRWSTNAGIIDFQQSGSEVFGTYQLYGDAQQYTIEGTVTDNILNGTYTGYDGGTIRFGLSPDGQRFDGAWFYRGQGQENHWCGVRSGPLWDGCGYSGDWESIGDYVPDYPPTMRLVQNGNAIEGTFLNGVSSSTGTIVGQVGTEGVGSQLTAVGRWSIDSAAGTFRWRLANLQSNQFMGRSTTADGQPHQWCGWRSGLSQPSPCLE